MKKILMIFMVIWLLVMSGCGRNRVWVKSGSTLEQFEHDKRECLYEAEKYGFVPITGNSRFPGADGISAGLQEGMRKVKLFNQCMGVKGYRLIDKNSLPSLQGDIMIKRDPKLWHEYVQRIKDNDELTWEEFLHEKKKE